MDLLYKPNTLILYHYTVTALSTRCALFALSARQDHFSNHGGLDAYLYKKPPVYNVYSGIADQAVNVSPRDMHSSE